MSNSESIQVTGLLNRVYDSESVSHIISKLSDFYNYLKRTLSPSHPEFQSTKKTILVKFGFYFIVYVGFSYVLYLTRMMLSNHFSRSKYFDSIAKRILVVTAHPDDECMFFGPLIMRMVKKNKCVYLLCLCNGDADGKGKLRKKELWSSCRILGLKAENIFLCHSSLREEGSVMWHSEKIGPLINEYVESFDIDTVVTFDKYGVNGQLNHISVFRAVSFLNLRKQLPMNCHIFLLDSLGFMRKYSSMTDCALSLFTSKNVFILPPYDHERVKRAIDTHKTQIFWFRRFYIMFSRYTYVNSLSELPRYTG